MCFCTFSALGSRMQARGLVNPLFVSQTTWFGIPDVCNTKGEWADMVSKTMKYVTAMMHKWALGWVRQSCGIPSYLIKRCITVGR